MSGQNGIAANMSRSNGRSRETKAKKAKPIVVSPSHMKTNPAKLAHQNRKAAWHAASKDPLRH